MTGHEYLDIALDNYQEPERPFTPLTFDRVSAVLKCPVVGSCLTRQEQQKILKKVGPLQNRATDFDMHELLVSHTDESNALCRAVQAMLDKKYATRVRHLHELSLPQLLKAWNTAHAQGDFGAELWAIATLPDAPQAVQRHVFGCVHMGMHRALDTCRQLERAVDTLRNACQQEQEKRRQSRLACNALRKEYDSMSQKYARARAAHTAQVELMQENTRLQQALRDATATAKAPPADTAALEQALVSAREQQAAAEARVEELRAALENVTREMTAQRTLALELQKEIGLLLKSPAPLCGEDCGETCGKTCGETCGECDCPRCPRRILIVGGINRMESLYRRIVEAQGGSLEYHNGCMAGGDKRLEGSLQRADLVLCPVNCNSHSACLAVKRLCRKYNKPVQMMSNFSLSAIFKAIAGNVADA